MIQVDKIHFAYPKGKPIFDGFSWDVTTGETWAILGSSGCGKSTLLSILAGLRLPDQGIIRINGQELLRPRPQTGLILQDYGLLPWFTVRDNSSLGIKVRGFYGPDGTHAPRESGQLPDVEYWLDRLGISNLADKYPSQISGGQRQRVAIARTLALHPDLLLMDEPFSSLDAGTRDDLQSLVLQLGKEQKLTMIIVTHSIEEALIMGKQILLLTRPPIYEPVILDNSHYADKDYTGSKAYRGLYNELKQRIGEE